MNDSTPKQLYINKHDGTFEEIGYQLGIALNENGREQAGMGLGVGDYNNDGLVDFYITNFSDDSNTLYRANGDANFTDATYQAGLEEPTIPFLGWGTAFIDFDNDGWKDILVANGHVYPKVDKFQWGTSYAQQMTLFRNLRPDVETKQILFDRVPANPKSGLAEAMCARGLAVGDLDGDGRMDAVVNNMDASPTVLRNVTIGQNHWLTLKLVGDVSKKTPRDTIGSKVFVTVGGVRQRFDVTSGASYASQSDQRVHVGLGASDKIEKLEIIWSNGETETVKIPTVDRVYYHRGRQGDRHKIRASKAEISAIEAGTRTIRELRLRLFTSRHIQPDSRNQDRAFDNVLHKVADIQQRHSVVEARHYQCSEACTEDRAAAAHERGSADNTGCDSVEFFQHSGVRCCTAASGEYQRGDAGKCAYQGVDLQDISLIVDTREPGRVRIAADRIEISAKRRRSC